MKYAIRITSTGDSFHTDIELGWSDIKIVEESVKCIEDTINQDKYND